MFSRLTYSQNNQAVFLMSVNKQKAIKKLPFGEFFVERIIALWPAKYHSWKPRIQLRAGCSFLQRCPQVRGGANQRAGQDSQLHTTLGSDWEDSAWGLIPCFEERCSVLLSTQYFSQHHDDKFIPDIERQGRWIYVDYFESIFFWSISTQFATCWDLELPLSLDLSQEQPPGIKSMSFSSLFTWYSFPLLYFFFHFCCFVKYFGPWTTSRY